LVFWITAGFIIKTSKPPISTNLPLFKWYSHRGILVPLVEKVMCMYH